MFRTRPRGGVSDNIEKLPIHVGPVVSHEEMTDSLQKSCDLETNFVRACRLQIAPHQVSVPNGKQKRVVKSIKNRGLEAFLGDFDTAMRHIATSIGASVIEHDWYLKPLPDRTKTTDPRGLGMFNLGDYQLTGSVPYTRGHPPCTVPWWNKDPKSTLDYSKRCLSESKEYDLKMTLYGALDDIGNQYGWKPEELTKLDQFLHVGTTEVEHDEIGQQGETPPLCLVDIDPVVYLV